MLALFLFLFSIVCALLRITWKILLALIIAFAFVGITITPTLVWWCFGIFVASLCINVSFKASKDED